MRLAWSSHVRPARPKLMEASGVGSGRLHGQPALGGPCGCAPLRATRLQRPMSAGCCASTPAETVEPDAETIRRARLEAARARPGASMFGNGCARHSSASRPMAKRARTSRASRLRCRHAGVRLSAVDLYGKRPALGWCRNTASPATVRTRRRAADATKCSRYSRSAGVAARTRRAARATAAARRRAYEKVARRPSSTPCARAATGSS